MVHGRAQYAGVPEDRRIEFPHRRSPRRCGRGGRWRSHRALSVDPENVEALIGSARADIIEGHFIFVTDPTTAFFAAEAKLTKALSSVPDHPRGHMLSGLVDMFTKRATRGIAECEHSLALDRNLVQAHSAIGLGKIFLSVAPKKTELTLPRRRCASVRAIL